jgi:hypothetical protein
MTLIDGRSREVARLVILRYGAEFRRPPLFSKILGVAKKGFDLPIFGNSFGLNKNSDSD